MKDVLEQNLVKMDPHAARRAFLEYRDAVRARHDQEDAQIMRGYRELARGRQLINLVDVIRDAGYDNDNRPRLAIARADQPTITMQRRSDGTITFCGAACRSWRHQQANGICTRFPDLAPPGIWKNGSAITPNMPPALRPARGLTRLHILWEAEWQPVAPRDPALLRHVGGDLWAVIAIWDLTDLERAVLSGRSKLLR